MNRLVFIIVVFQTAISLTSSISNGILVAVTSYQKHSHEYDSRHISGTYYYCTRDRSTGV